MTRPASSWEARVSRARQLATPQSAAAGILQFYAVVASAQAQVLEHHRDALRQAPAFAESLDVPRLSSAVAALLAVVGYAAPPAVAAAAERLRHGGEEASSALLAAHWAGREDEDPTRAFIAEAVLQPFAEAIARRERVPEGSAPGTCPVCARLPFAGVLREEGQSARRALVCGFCLTEWRVPRLLCVACGEASFAKLAVYTADEFPVARLDCCESCKVYLKTIDLTHDGTAIPIVDDIATVPLDLWAREQGFERLRPNLLRL